MSLGPDAPPPQNYGQQTADTIKAQVDNAPAVYNANATYSPKYAALSTENLNTYLNGTDGKPGALALYKDSVSPVLQQVQLKNQADQRAADVGAVEQLGSRAVQAFQNANPQQKALIDKLNQQASAGLDAGTGLSPEEMRQAQQAARAASAARGDASGPSSIYAETQNVGAAGVQRQRERQAFAGQIAQLDQSTTPDAFQAVLGRSALPGTAGQNLFGSSQAGAGAAGAQAGSQFNPESAYAQNLYDTNFNQQSAQAIAGGNAFGSLFGSFLGAGSNVGSAYLWGGH